MDRSWEGREVSSKRQVHWQNVPQRRRYHPRPQEAVFNYHFQAKVKKIVKFKKLNNKVNVD